MKFERAAPSIARGLSFWRKPESGWIPAFAGMTVMCFILFLAACDTLGIPDLTRHDEVPDEVKAQPRLIETTPPLMADESGWPRLGDVPSKPNDFSPPAANNHYMNEMELSRDDARAVKRQVEDEAPVVSGTPRSVLSPPQLPKE